MARVIAERLFPQPIDIGELKITAREFGGCFDRHGVAYLYGYIAPDRQRMICVYEAPDAESVRIANRQTGMPFECIYTATVHEPTVDAAPGADDGRASTDVLVERTFSTPVVFSDLQAIEDAGAWCLNEHGVTFVRTYFAIDRRRMLCRYRASDAESVRIVNRRLGMPVDTVWPITHFRTD
jgi:hypothetical protein